MVKLAAGTYDLAATLNFDARFGAAGGMRSPEWGFQWDFTCRVQPPCLSSFEVGLQTKHAPAQHAGGVLPRVVKSGYCSKGVRDVLANTRKFLGGVRLGVVLILIA